LTPLRADISRIVSPVSEAEDGTGLTVAQLAVPNKM
jgi:hypothetical protein